MFLGVLCCLRYLRIATVRRPIAISAPIIPPTTSPTEVEDGDIGVAALEDEEGTEVVVCMVPAGTDTETFATLYSDNVNERHR